MLYHAMFAVNLGPADNKVCIKVGLRGVLKVVETVVVERVASENLCLLSCWKLCTICITQLKVKTKTGNARITWHRGAFLQPFLWSRCSEYYTTCVCVCSLMYPACNSHVPYCHLLSARLYNIFPRYLTNGMIFGKKEIVIEHKKMYIGVSVKCHLFFSDFNITWIFSTGFRKTLICQI